MRDKLLTKNTGEINKEVLVSVNGVSKKFCKNLKRSMAYGIVELSRNLIGIKNNSARLRKDEFWAVNDISFELRRGDVFGLIGINGSGKSTLLRLLTGIFPPDKGQILVKGRVGALIAVGAGFHPHMTGRENIYLNGTLLGMSRDEIDSKFQDIVDFAEIGHFLDAPVSTYSSGMRVRLGFAIAIQIRPDVLLVDEVLAVGDLSFRVKCYNAIAKLAKNAAIVFVSHSMTQIAKVSTSIGVMSYGRFTFLGNDVPGGIDHYYSQIQRCESIVTGNGRARIEGIELNEVGDPESLELNYLDDLQVSARVSVNHDIREFVLNISILDQEQQIVAQCNSLYNRVVFENTSSRIRVSATLKSLSLNPGQYFLSLGVMDKNFREVFFNLYAAKTINVRGHFVGASPVQLLAEWNAEEDENLEANLFYGS